MSLLSLLRSDLYKYVHASLWIWHLVIPAGGAGLFVWYYSISAMQKPDKIALYMEVLAVTFPFMIGIITGMVSQMEQDAAGYQLLLFTPTHKFLPHFSKLSVILLMGAGASFLAAVGFGMGVEKFEDTGFFLLFYVEFAGILFLSMLPLYILHYLVSFFLGGGYSIGLGIAGSLLCALLLTGLGDDTWWFLPWGIAARLSMNFFAANIADGSIFQYTYVQKGLTALALFVLVLMLSGGILLESWEGRKTEN